MYGRLLSPEYIDGVNQFMRFVQGKFSENAEILCPCSRCLNHKYLRQPLVKQHMLRNGMDSSYTRWIHHGESLHADIIEHPIDEQDNGESSIPMEAMAEDDNYGADHLHGLLGELHSVVEARAENQDGDPKPLEKNSFLEIAMREAKRLFYPGCSKFSRFSFVVRLLHMKCLYRICNSAFTAILKLLSEAFPEHNSFAQIIC